MPQTVFDVGDAITSRLKLGVVPDGTTVVTVDVLRPDGTAILDPVISAFENVDEKVAQFYATDTGAAGATTVDAAGDWVVIWYVTGTGASVSPKVYNVRELPATATRPTWAPFLSNVADYVSWMTVDITTPGGEVPLGTFNGNTSPTDEQAHRLLDAAVSYVGAALGGTVAVSVYPIARAVAAIRAAAAIARSFARSAEDRAAADALDRRASADLLVLIQANADVGAPGSTGADVPVWGFPEPVAWGDDDL